MCSRNLTLDEISNLIDESDFLTEKDKVQGKLKVLEKFTRWNEEDYSKYEELLEKLKTARLEMKKKKAIDRQKSSKVSLGKALEDLVNFIFQKSYFYKVYPNKRTSTNEIDQFVVLSDKGKQAIKDYNFSEKLLGTIDGYFLCECKNYNHAVQGTWIGKFYTLLKISGGCSLGIIFSCEGLTGKENSWYDAHGLTKIIYRMSPEIRRTFILDFNINDFELLKSKDNTIFSIINSKKESLVSNVKSEKLLDDNCEGKEEIKKIYNEIKNN